MAVGHAFQKRETPSGKAVRQERLTDRILLRWILIDPGAGLNDIDVMRPQPRRRARARFTTELPRRVPPIVRDDTSFDHLVEYLTSIPALRERARENLLLIARDYRFSRDLNLARVSRSDTAETLRAISSSGRSVVESLDGLSSEASEALETLIPGVGELDWEPGIKALDTLAEVLLGFSEAAFDLVQGTLQLRLAEGDRTLTPVVNATETAGRQLSCFPDAAKWWLVVMQQYEKLAPDPNTSSGDLAAIGKVCTNLSRLAGAAAEVSKADRGPRSSTAQMRAVQRLKDLYEAATGRKATNSLKSGRHYTGVFESEFGRFAENAFHSMEPDSTLRRGLAQAVSYAVWGCRTASAESKGARARDDFERRTLRALEMFDVTNNSSPSV